VVSLWFQTAGQQLQAEIWLDIRAKILPELKRVCPDSLHPDVTSKLIQKFQLRNRARLDGIVVPYEIVPFDNGADPTQPPVRISFTLMLSTS
jgi:hypothetical protein